MRGIITALITPFYKGRVDEESLLQLLQQQLQAGVRAFVINGTTGESPTLTQSEVEQIFKFVRHNTPDNTTLILGAGLNSTQKTLDLIQALKHLKPDAWLSVVPYYNKPPQAGLVEHFKALAAEVENLILYNVPGRTVVGLNNESIVELSRVPHIVGIKEASGHIEVLQTLQPQTPKDFAWLSGDDTSCMGFIEAGGGGVISVLSHLIPGPMVQIFKDLEAARNSQTSSTRTSLEEYINYRALNLLLGIETNPMPVKMALYLMGVIRSPELRLPLTTLSDSITEKLKPELRRLQLLKN